LESLEARAVELIVVSDDFVSQLAEVLDPGSTAGLSIHQYYTSDIDKEQNEPYLD
jgi:hypothetical protein